MPRVYYLMWYSIMNQMTEKLTIGTIHVLLEAYMRVCIFVFYSHDLGVNQKGIKSVA